MNTNNTNNKLSNIYSATLSATKAIVLPIWGWFTYLVARRPIITGRRIRYSAYFIAFLAICRAVIFKRRRKVKIPSLYQMISSTLYGHVGLKEWYYYSILSLVTLTPHQIGIEPINYMNLTIYFKQVSSKTIPIDNKGLIKFKALISNKSKIQKLNKHGVEASIRNAFKNSFKSDPSALTLTPSPYATVSGRSPSETNRLQFGFEQGDYHYGIRKTKNKFRALVFTNSFQHLSDRELGYWFSLQKPIYAFVPHITQPFLKGSVLFTYLEANGLLYTKSTIDGGSTYVEPYYIYTTYDYVSITYQGLEYISKFSYHKPTPNTMIMHYQPVAKIIPGFLNPQPVRRTVKLEDKNNIIRYHDSLTYIGKVGNTLVTSKHKIGELEIIHRMTNGSSNSTANVLSRKENKNDKSAEKFDQHQYLRAFNLTTVVKDEHSNINIIDDNSSGTYIPQRQIHDINDVTVPEAIPKDENIIVLQKNDETRTVSMNNKPEVKSMTAKHTNVGGNKSFLPEKSEKSKLFAVRLRYLSRSNCPNLGTKKTDEIIRHMDEFISKIYLSTGPTSPLNLDELAPKYKECANDAFHSICRKYKWQEVDIFVKGEAYSSCKGSRTISNVNTHQVMEGLRFSGPIHKLMADKVHWYGPGKTKINYVDALSDAPIDYSGWDGSVPFILKILFYKLLIKYFPTHKKLITTIVGSELFSVFKVKPKRSKLLKSVNTILVLAAVLSGGSMTASGNTWIAGFLQYHTLRVLGLSSSEAWNNIGIVYGDDGNVKRIYFNEFCSYVTSTFGIKATKEAKYQPGIVPFLGKIFEDDKGTLSPDRILYKFSLSFSNFSDLDNILLKWSGFYNPKIDLADQIPIFSTLGKMAFEQLRSKDKFKEQLAASQQWKSKEFLGKSNKNLFVYRMGKTNYQKFADAILNYIQPLVKLSHKDVKKITAIVNDHTFDCFPTPTTIKPNVTLYIGDVMYQSNEYDGDYNHQSIVNFFNIVQKFEIFHNYHEGRAVNSVLLEWRRIVKNTYETLIKTAIAKTLKTKYSNELELFMIKTKYLKKHSKNNDTKNLLPNSQVKKSRRIKADHPNGQRPNKSLNYSKTKNKKKRKRNGEQTKQKFTISKKKKAKSKTKTKLKKIKYVKTSK